MKCLSTLFSGSIRGSIVGEVPAACVSKPSVAKVEIEFGGTGGVVLQVEERSVFHRAIKATLFLVPIRSAGGRDRIARHLHKRATVDPRKTTCMLYLQADHQFFARYGTEEACIEVMTRHVQRVNSIYKHTGGCSWRRYTARAEDRAEG